MCKLAVALLLLTSCAKADRTYDEGLGDAGGTFGVGDRGVRGLAECAESTKDPYVIADDATLYSFHPPTNEFKSHGLISCPAAGARPTSMAVDRTGIAFVRYSDGSIWRVSMAGLACQGTSYVPRADAFFKFGMGFSSETKGSATEALFLSDDKGSGLGKLDTNTMQLKAVGPFTGDLAGRTAELTGTGDGKLYGLFTTSPARVAEISKGTGQILSSSPISSIDGAALSAWAFSFYGGDFYIYTASNGTGGFPQAGAGSSVTRFRPSDGSVTAVKPVVGFRIVGAGVSTCAPTTLPR